jgi:hypothetical protein
VSNTPLVLDEPASLINLVMDIVFSLQKEKYMSNVLCTWLTSCELETEKIRIAAREQ